VQPGANVLAVRGIDRGSISFLDIRLSAVVNAPPDCSELTASPDLLWPPNHKYRLVTVGGATDPDGDAVTVAITGVTQDEPLNGLADGNTSLDAAAAGPGAAKLRAERSGRRDGRVYCVVVEASDELGGRCTGTVVVGVPHDRGKRSTPVDSGLSFDSFGP
jgi:hypothetical protein